MATKQQEREALDKIAEIIKGLGQDATLQLPSTGALIWQRTTSATTSCAA